MFMSALICGLNGAGSALGSPNAFCAAAGPWVVRTIRPAASHHPSFRIPDVLSVADAGAVAPGWLSRRASDPLQRALVLDGNFRICTGRRAPHDSQLPVAVLVALHLDVLGVDLLAEARH